MDSLIKALGQNIKPKGANWVAKCPVHADKDFATDIKYADDGSVLAHCHACGANGLDLYRALGLPLDELFGFRESKKQMMPQKIREIYKIDQLAIDIYLADREAGRIEKYADKKRYKLALARVKGVEEKYIDG